MPTTKSLQPHPNFSQPPGSPRLSAIPSPGSLIHHVTLSLSDAPPEHHSLASWLLPQGMPKDRCKAHAGAGFCPYRKPLSTLLLQIHMSTGNLYFFYVVPGMEPSASRVRQVLCQLSTPKPILRVVSITTYFFPESPRPVGSSPPALVPSTLYL